MPVSDADRQYKKNLIRNIKSGSGCEVCGEQRYYCLDFHHKDQSEKEGEISKMLSNGTSLNKVLSEITKCSLLCANCHREVHYQEALSGIEIKKKEIESEIMLWDLT